MQKDVQGPHLGMIRIQQEIQNSQPTRYCKQPGNNDFQRVSTMGNIKHTKGINQLMFGY